MIIECHLPGKTVSNADLEARFPDWSAQKVEDKIGINLRHVAAGNETALDLAFAASVKALGRFDKDKIDFLLLCTQSPDYFLPTSACVLQDRLGLRTDVGALDINLGCSGFVYGLAMAKGLIKAGIAANVLLVTAETYSKHIHPADRANLSIFGDGAAATILGVGDVERMFEFVLGTDGRGKDNLIVANGGARGKAEGKAGEAVDEGGNFRSPDHLYMNGPEIFNFTIANVPVVVDEVLRRNSLAIDDIDYVVFHQANKYMLDYLRKKTKIPKEKFHNDMLCTGNTVSSTIPIALRDCLDKGIVKNGDKVLLVGFGVGYSWGGVVLDIQC